MTAPLPEVVVKSIRTNPGTPRAGTPFALHFEFLNRGRAPTGADQKYSITCEPSCPLPPGPHPFDRILQPDETLPVTLNATFPSAGFYSLIVKPLPGVSRSKTVTVVTVEVEQPPAPLPKPKRMILKK
jgi:hypothetical protein